MSERKNSLNTFERMRNVIVHTLNVAPDDVTLQARFREDLDADSLDIVELIIAIEREFEADVFRHVDPSWEETLEACAAEISTVGQLVEYLDLLAPLCCSRPLMSETRIHQRELEFRKELWRSPNPQKRVLALLMTANLHYGEIGWLC